LVQSLNKSLTTTQTQDSSENKDLHSSINKTEEDSLLDISPRTTSIEPSLTFIVEKRMHPSLKSVHDVYPRKKKSKILLKLESFDSLHKTVICNECDQEKSSVKDIKHHMQTEHSPKIDLKYKIAYKTEFGKVLVGAERLRGRKVYTCSFCSYLSNKISNIKQHLSGYHKDVFLKSPENGYVTRVKIEYEEGEDSCQPVSKRRHDYKNIDSNATDLTTRLADPLVQPLNQSGGLHCEKCDFETFEEERLKHHKQVGHPVKMYSCEHCEYSATRNQCLKKHMKLNHTGFRYSCDECENKFKCPAALKDHVNSQHQGKYYHCHVCDWRGGHRTSLQKHIRIKHLKQRVKCGQCEYEAMDASSLKKHMNSRHARIWIKCDECDFKAEDAACLKRHRIFCHMIKEKFFNCTTCTTQTGTREGIISHMLEVHDLALDERGGRYACSVCSFKTKTKGALTKHKEHLHAKAVYDCDYCGYKSPNPWTLKRHLSTQHQMVVNKDDLIPRNTQET